MWLGGKTQWEDHRIGKKHRTKLEKFGGGASKEQRHEEAKKPKVPEATVWLMEHDAVAPGSAESLALDEMD